jgi:hypothetical protein
LTRLGGGGYGSRPLAARSRIAALAILVLATACNDSQRSVPPTFDRFYYPTGLAVRHEPAGCTPGTDGCQSQLFVASSNFDLRYDALTGGTMLSVDVGQALGRDPLSNAAAGPLPAPALLGGTRIGSFAGEVAVADETSCPGWQSATGAQVLVTSRAQNALDRVDLDPATGALPCGDAFCGGPNEVPLSTHLADAYGVTVACGNLAPAGGGALEQRHLVFVTFLRAQSAEGFLSRVSDTGGLETTYDVGAGPTQSTAFDETRGLLFMSERFSSVGVAKLRWLDLTFPQLGVTSIDYGAVVRGAELVSLALSSDRSRIYLAARLYDVDTATTTGTRPVGDSGAALLVIDVNRVLSGATAADTVLNVVRLDRGPVALVAIPRKDASGKPIGDLVALTSSDDGTMTLYDDELGATAAVFGVCDSSSTLPINRPRSAGGGGLAPDPCPDGNPTLGKQPYGIAWEPYQTASQTGLARLFVGSFDRAWVNAIVLDPTHPGAPISWARIGPERQ